MAMVVASSSRIPNSLQRQSILVAGSNVGPIWSVNVPTFERTTHNSKTANASTFATKSGRKNAFSTTCGDGSEFASMTTTTTTTTTTTNRRRSTTGRRRQNKISTPRAEKRNEDGSIEDDDSSNFSFLSMELLLQTVIVVFTLGFIDAGGIAPRISRKGVGNLWVCRYSGDWSRIGALSKEKEELLRIAAYGVVPLSAAAVWAIGNRSKSSM